ncbi:Hypothetical_protein [Hexamita inflata]|uniref:Hypothetical_protein n=1 Tax=Hexamita inflata TaxID=28002 RepID=A0ABP1HFL9_9EUKA
MMYLIVAGALYNVSAINLIEHYISGSKYKLMARALSSWVTGLEFIHERGVDDKLLQIYELIIIGKHFSLYIPLYYQCIWKIVKLYIDICTIRLNMLNMHNMFPSYSNNQIYNQIVVDVKALIYEFSWYIDQWPSYIQF